MDGTETCVDIGTAGSAVTLTGLPVRSVWAMLWGYRPRPETAVLLVSTVLTVMVKFLAVRKYEPNDLLSAWTAVVASDVAFFLMAVAAFRLLYALWPRPAVARATLLIAALLLVWSVLNGAWLLATGVQLHAGIVAVLLRHPREFYPVVRPWIGRTRGGLKALVAAAAMATALWLMGREIWPRAAAAARRQHLLWAGAAVLVAIACALVPRRLPAVGMGSLGPVLSYSSHGQAIQYVVRAASPTESPQRRHVPRVGEQRVQFCDVPRAERPNVIVLLLESISYEAAGLSDLEHPRMSHLARLRAEGIEFAQTRVPVSQTGKAFWATLSGMTPEIASDYTEAVLVDQPYEGLPSLLRQVGYRSAFFQMARGSFECAPGVFANFAFDWAWFRENLEDAGAHVGYLSGDDFRMLDPALAWATADERPFFLMMITSVSHDPYEVPAWFAEPAQADYERYLQCVDYTDAFLAELQTRLERRGLAERTLLCVLGDHGESFRPEARHTRWVSYDEVLRIPWVVRWPGHVPAGQRYTWPCSQLDVTPTLLSLLGADLSAASFDGRNALVRPDASRRLYFSAWFEGSPSGYVEEDVKWLYWPDDGRVFRIDLHEDPCETSPQEVTGVQRAEVVAAVNRWERESRLVFPPSRFRERFLFDHWSAFCSGRYARAYYVP